ncbi:MAG: hypothetical protein ACI9UA_006045 [Pseudoalteromonas tetraodonis]|jgi:hypothetical protein
MRATRFNFVRSHIYLMILASFLVGNSLGQEDATEAQPPLTRVKPADIGSKRGRVSTEVNIGESDAENDASATPKKGGGAALEIIFDCSNSMNARLGGVAKIDLAKQALFHLTDALEKTNLQVGLRVFGHDRSIDREDRPKACVNSELMIPIEASSAAKIRSTIPKLTAWGRTPIAYSLDEAGNDLDPFLEDSPMILLISDGLESCDRDPLKAILDLEKRGVNVRTFVIGFDLNKKERDALMQIAAAGNGKYYNASDFSGLVESFDQFAADAALVKKAPEKKKYSNPAQGGSTFAEAVEIAPGRYTVWKDLAKGEWAYFKVPSTKGQRVAVKAHIKSNAIYRDDGGKFREAKYARGSAMIWIYGEDGKRIPGRRVQLSGEVGNWEREHTLDIGGSGSVFAIGSDYNPTSRHIVFEVTVQEAGDLYEGWEAPDSKDSDAIFSALVDQKFFGHLGTEDKVDVYRVDLEAAGHPEKLDLSIVFSDVDQPCKFLIEVYNAKGKKRIARFTKLESSKVLEIPTDGLDAVLISIRDNNPALYHLMNSYEIEIKTQK